MDYSSKIYVAGHLGMVGSALQRRLQTEGYSNLICRSINELDLLDQQVVNHFFETEQPEYVFLAAAKVGGIQANSTFRAQFLYENLMIQSNVIHAAFTHQVKKLLFLGSSCIYPKLAPQPLKEEYLLTGTLEWTNEPYSIAKISGIKMCENYYRQYGCNYISIMPTNLYGPNDNYDLDTSHVLPALIRRFHEAKEKASDSLTLWGSGSPRREFLHVDDMTSACLFLMKNLDAPRLYDMGISHINIGCGQDLMIKELAEIIRNITGCKSVVQWDTSKPDGTPRKLLDISRLLSLGWKPSIPLSEGITQTYQYFLSSHSK